MRLVTISANTGKVLKVWGTGFCTDSAVASYIEASGLDADEFLANYSLRLSDTKTLTLDNADERIRVSL